jgi:hypothetical protein
MAEDVFAQCFVFLDTGIDTHAESSEHNANESTQLLAVINDSNGASLPPSAGAADVIEVVTRQKATTFSTSGRRWRAFLFGPV